MQQTYLRIALFFALVGLFQTAPWGHRLASAYEFNRTDNGAPLHWKRFPIGYAIDTAGLGEYYEKNKDWGVSGSEFDAIENSFRAWAGITCGGIASPLQFQSTGRVPSTTAIGYNESCDSCNTNLIRFFLDQGQWRHDQQSLAMTTTTQNLDTGEILDADMEINASNPLFRLTTQTEDENNIFRDIQNTVTHEIGHMVGLGHSDVEKATMYASALDQELKKRDLDADDIQAVCTLYKPKEINVPIYKQIDIERGLGCSTVSAHGDGWLLWSLGLLCLFVLRRGRLVR